MFAQRISPCGCLKRLYGNSRHQIACTSYQAAHSVNSGVIEDARDFKRREPAGTPSANTATHRCTLLCTAIISNPRSDGHCFYLTYDHLYSVQKGPLVLGGPRKRYTAIRADCTAPRNIRYDQELATFPPPKPEIQIRCSSGFNDTCPGCQLQYLSSICNCSRHRARARRDRYRSHLCQGVLLTNSVCHSTGTYVLPSLSSGAPRPRVSQRPQGGASGASSRALCLIDGASRAFRHRRKTEIARGIIDVRHAGRQHIYAAIALTFLTIKDSVPTLHLPTTT